MSMLCLLLLYLICGPINGQRLDDNELSNSLSADPWPDINQGDNSIYLENRDVMDNMDCVYVVIASKIVRPSTVFSVVVSLLRTPDNQPLEVRASLRRDTVEVSSALKLMVAGSPERLLLQVPRTSAAGSYSLRVEGNHNGVVGGSVFHNSTELDYDSQFLSVIIQLNKPMYNGEQTVRFRAIMLDTALRPYDDPVDVYILDPNGYVARRWPSRQTSNGVVDLSFDLPVWPMIGWWSIKISANRQETVKKFYVERYWEPRFEVSVGMPTYFLDTEEAISGSIESWQTNDNFVYGNATARLYTRSSPEEEWRLITEETEIEMANEAEFEFSMSLVADSVRSLSGSEVKVEADVYEVWMGATVTGFSSSRIISGTLYLRFLTSSPGVFKPGMPFEDYIAVSYKDAQPLDEDLLESVIITITPTFTDDSGRRYSLPDIVIEGPEGSTSKVQFICPEDATEMRLKATYMDEDGGYADTELFAVAQYSLQQRHLQIYTTTEHANIGEYTVLHVRSDFLMTSFNYIVLAKGLIVYVDKQTSKETTPTIKTFSVPVSSEMAPLFHVLVYHITDDSEMISDSVSISVNSISQHQVSLSLNDRKDHSMDTIEINTVAEAGAFFGVSSVRELGFRMQLGNELSQASIMESLYSFEKFNRSVHGVLHRFREGDPDYTDYFNSASAAPDTNRTIEFLGLVLFTNVLVPLLPSVSYCNISLGYQPCILTGCYRTEERCNGEKDCSDGSDEAGCNEFPDTEDTKHFRLHRFSHFADIYDAEDGDWAWYSLNIGQDAEEINTLEVPKAADSWILNAFAVSKRSGLGLIEAVIPYEDTRPFYITAEAPESVRRGEQIGIRVICLNNMPYEMIAMLELADSEDYKFVHVEKFGVVSSYDPKTTSGVHQHLVYIPAEDVVEVLIPIVPTIEQGDIEVTISALSQIRRDEETLEISVEPEGVSIGEHTAVMLDLKNRAYVLQFFKVSTDESPIVPDEHWRRFVFGSPAGTVSVTGDVVGPIFPEVPVNKDVLLGSPSRTTDDFLFDFASNLWSLHYFRLTNQWDWDLAKEVFDHMSTMYEQLLYRHSIKGGFFMFNGQNSSVWLTSHVVKHLRWANFPDWEMIFYIDPKVISDSVDWMLQFQESSGAFVEHPDFRNPMNPRMDARSRTPGDPKRYRDVPLTAHVLITLHETLGNLQGHVKSRASLAKQRAQIYLEKILPSLADPYDVAITTYALTLVNSLESEAAFQILGLVNRTTDGYMYWSRGEIGSIPVKSEFNRPFLLPKEDFAFDSLAVEATSYALLTYIIREGVTFQEERFVSWLTSMRKNDGAFNAAADSLTAMQALVEFSWRARLRDITQMTVSVEMSANPGVVETLTITNESISEMKSIDLENVWGHVDVIARGAGQAVLQYDASFGVDFEPLKETPPIDSFQLNVTEKYSIWRNSSIIYVKLCTRWINLEEANTSGVAVIEAEVPSGYVLVQNEAEAIVAKKEHPNLMDVHASGSMMSWYFDHIGARRECFNYQLRRWFPVANLTRFRAARIYELYQPERFEVTMYNVTSLYVLNICEVCGSYQCPYCPAYSSSPGLQSVMLLPAILLLVKCVVL